MKNSFGGFGGLFAAADFLDRIGEPFIKVDVFDAGEAENGQEEVA